MKGMVGGVKGTSIVAGMLVAAMGLGGCSQGSDTGAVQKDNAARVESDGTADQVQATFDISRNDEYGHVDIHVDGEQFHELGFDYGDSLDLIFSNGYEVRDIPYYTGFYSKIGEPLVLDYPGIEWLWASINLGDAFWDVAGLSEGDTVTVVLNEKGKYEDVQNARNIEYTDNREDYASDAMIDDEQALDVNSRHRRTVGNHYIATGGGDFDLPLAGAKSVVLRNYIVYDEDGLAGVDDFRIVRLRREGA